MIIIRSFMLIFLILFSGMGLGKDSESQETTVELKKGGAVTAFS